MSYDVSCSTLAGSTIMLLTIPWFGGLILGRVDIIRKVGRDGKCSKFTFSSLWKQVSVYNYMLCMIKNDIVNNTLSFHCCFASSFITIHFTPLKICVLVSTLLMYPSSDCPLYRE